MTITRMARLFGGLVTLEKAVVAAEAKVLADNAAKGDQGDPSIAPGSEPLRKAVTSDLMQDVIREDLEGYAHSTLWSASSPSEFTLLKIIPTTPATRVSHEYTRITSYGEDRGFGFFGEQTLPRETQPTFDRHVTNIRLIGETSQTYLLASLQKTINVAGETTPEGIAKKMLVLSILRKKARAVYFSDTSTDRLGAAGARFKGVMQLIREGTDGTTGSSPFGSHVIDLEGEPLTITTLRRKSADLMNLFGYLHQLIMSNHTRADFEASMDPAQRLAFPAGTQAMYLGQHIGGLHTQGNDIQFLTDTMLGPWGRGRYFGTGETGAPTSAPAVTGTAGAVGGSRTSKWKATDAGEYFWIITEVKDDRESIGRRIPSTGTTSMSAGFEMVLDITPTDANSDSFRIYRGRGSQNPTDAIFAFEVANSNSGAVVTAYDLNHYRPGTSVAFGLSIRSDAAQAIAVAPNGAQSGYASAREKSDKFLTQADAPENTLSLATLGPAMGVMELAAVLATTTRPLVYSACAPQMRNPLHNLVFINIGDTSFVPPGA